VKNYSLREKSVLDINVLGTKYFIPEGSALEKQFDMPHLKHSEYNMYTINKIPL
jgi:hypothetical protein